MRATPSQARLGGALCILLCLTDGRAVADTAASASASASATGLAVVAASASTADEPPGGAVLLAQQEGADTPTPEPDEAPQARPPSGRGALLVNAEGVQDVVWDDERRAGAVAVRGHILVIDELRHPGGPAAEVPGLVAVVPARGVDHLVLAADTGRVYGSGTRDGMIHAVTLADGAVTKSFPAGGPQPGVLFYHPALHRLASFNAGASTVTLFDTSSLAFEGLIPIGDAPSAVRMAPDGRLLALLPERRELTLLGLRPLRIFGRWPLPSDCLRPFDLAVDPVGQRAFIACGTSDIAVFQLRDGDWGAPLAGAASGAEIGRVFWDGVRKRVIAVAEDGSVSAAAAEASAVAALTLVPAGAHLAFDAAQDRLLTVSSEEHGDLRIEFVPLR